MSLNLECINSEFYLLSCSKSSVCLGAAVGFKLDSLPKLSETRARNNRMTLMHYLCKVSYYSLRFCSFMDVPEEERYSLMDSLQILAEKIPEVLDFTKELSSLEAATKVLNFHISHFTWNFYRN